MVRFHEHDYEIVKGKDNFIIDEVSPLFTSYFLPFDYVLGDYSYDKIRLKGFYDSNNKNVSDINNIKNLDSYINDFCSYGARTFLLKKIS